jgi:stage II sporulation protein D
LAGTPTSAGRHRAAVVSVLLALVFVPAASSQTRELGTGVLVISGHGVGHGIGLSQWGAEERAAAGQTLAEILAFYYPGTSPGTAPGSSVRVLVADRAAVRIGSTAGFSIAGARGAVLHLPAGIYAIDARGRVDGHILTLPAVVRPGSAPLRVAGTGYPGTLTIDRAGGRIHVVNTLDLERYVADVVSVECPGTWRPAALEAQAVASRSYALANLRPAAEFDLYPDDRSQNYHGLARELPSAVAAAAATRGQVLLYDGVVADTLFSAANGGLTTVPDGVWANVSLPYFSVRPDPFDARSPVTNWGPVAVPLSKLRRLFPQLPPVVTGVSLSRNAGGRVTSLTFSGADGSVSLGGYVFQQRLGLRSTYFAVG